MPVGRCRCGGVRYRLKSRTQLRLLQGGELLEECGPWRLCGRCGTTVFRQGEGDATFAVASTIEWPGQNVDDLHSAARDKTSDLRRLIRRGLPLEGRERGETPLMLAAFNGRVKASRILLDHGARLDSAIREAAGSCSSGIVRLFLERAVDRLRFFRAVVRFGLVRDARLAIEGMDVNGLSESGYVPLWSAALNSRPMVRFLLKRGADPEVPNRDGRHASGLCAFRGLAGRLKIFLEAGLSVPVLEEALVAACRGGRRRCFELLVQAGAPVLQTDYTPLMAAAESGALELVGRLMELGADPSAVDDEGKSALDYARSQAIRERLSRA